MSQILKRRRFIDSTHTTEAHARMGTQTGHCQPEIPLAVTQAASQAQPKKHRLQPKRQHVSLGISCTTLDDFDHSGRPHDPIHINHPLGFIRVTRQTSQQPPRHQFRWRSHWREPPLTTLLNQRGQPLGMQLMHFPIQLIRQPFNENGIRFGLELVRQKPWAADAYHFGAPSTFDAWSIHMWASKTE